MSGIGIMYCVGAGIRYLLMHSKMSSTIQNRVEVSTPINGWLRVKEGVFLHSQGIPVYSGGIYHGSPLELLFSGFLLRSWADSLPFIFILSDLLTAACLTMVASAYCRKLLLHQEFESGKYASDAKSILLKGRELTEGINFVGVAYLFSPFTIASCVGQTSTVFANLFLAANLVSLLYGYPILFGFLTAVCAYQSFYPLCLIVPGIVQFSTEKDKSIPKMFISFFVTLFGLLLISHEIAGGWDFMEATYGFILSAPDLSPNIGLFWYFFTEMFEHFRLFFLATFQVNAFIYVIPLATKLSKDSMLLTMALLALTAVFKSYPCLGDVGFYMAMLPMWRHLYSYLRQTFLVGCMLVATSILGPIMYNLWIFNGSANANFYFAVTLAFNTAQIFLVTDLLFAHVKRQYHLYNGSKLEVDGQPATLALE